MELIDMVECFIKVRKYITQYLELYKMDTLAEVIFNLLCDLVNAKSIKLAIECLSRQDEISKTLMENLQRRIAERTNKN